MSKPHGNGTRNRSQQLTEAILLHQAGKLPEAERKYRKVLAEYPHNAEALNGMGIIFHQQRQATAALPLLRQAVEECPENPLYLHNLGVASQSLGLPEEARAAFEQALHQDPRFRQPLLSLAKLALAENELIQALGYYERYLSLGPGSFAVYHDLALICARAGRLDEAIAWYRKALAIKEDLPEVHLHLGNALHTRGNYSQALASFQRALQLRPDYLDALVNIGTALQFLGRTEKAVFYFQRALAVREDLPLIHTNLGNAYGVLGESAKAMSSYRRALDLQPDFLPARINLGGLLQSVKRHEEAIDCFRQAIEARQDLPQVHFKLGIALHCLGRLEEAKVAFEKTLALVPDHVEALIGMGVVCKDLHDLEQALYWCEKSYALAPDNPETCNNLGFALDALGRAAEADALYRQAIRLQPSYADAHFNRSVTLLRSGSFEEGWRAYEWRWRTEALASAVRNFGRPAWDGAELGGKTIFLPAEQGFGDTIQFARYAPLVAGRGGRVVIECRAALAGLLQGVSGVAEVVVRGRPLPQFDVHFPLLSLPFLFGTRLETIPRDIPYLRVGEQRLAVWQERIPAAQEAAIGLVWQGNPRHANDHNRSLDPGALRPLLDISGLRFFSLQLGTPLPAVGKGNKTDLAPWLTDFTETAAALMRLDLLVTVDTAVAHLAGALGRPVWLLLPHVPDWRWLLDREDSPWYPTMRLFRQPRAGDWDAVLAWIAGELRLLAAKGRERAVR